MRIDIPVYIKTGPRVEYKDGNAVIRNADGKPTWEYHGKNFNGIGIAACARSGTVYMSRVLRELGYDIGHEEMGKDGSVGYHLAVIKPKGCLHQVRHPLKQIASMHQHQSWGFMQHVVDIEGEGLLGCMQYWLRWNELIEEFAEWRYQLEQIPEIWHEFCDRIGHKRCPIPRVPRNTNSNKEALSLTDREQIEFSWEDLLNCDRQLTCDIIEMAKRYGYDTPEMDKVEYQNLQEPARAEVAPV